MLFRNCAGGIVFNNDKVFVLKNEKGEWVLPKGKIRDGSLAVETAISRVKEETGIDAEIISSAGETSYEFFSISRKKPVCNEITWYIMESKSDEYKICEKDFIDGRYFDIDEALETITYSQDKSLVRLAYKKYKTLKKEQVLV